MFHVFLYLRGVVVIKWAQNGQKCQKWAIYVIFAQNIHEATYIIIETTQIVRLTIYGIKIYDIFQFYSLLGGLGAEKLYQNGRNFNKMGIY